MKNVFIILVLIIVTAISCREKDAQPLPVSGEVKLGAILDLTGNYSEEGLTGKAAIDLAIESLNQRYAAAGSSLQFSCSYADTHMDTNLTLSAAKTMYANGIRLLVAGPGNSTELKSIKSWLDANKVLALTCFSSSPSLAIPGDYIFRLITDDNVQGQALVSMMQYDSIYALIPLWREDTYGTGLCQTIREKFNGPGKIVMSGISYSPGATNYNELINLVNVQVDSAIAIYGASHVAVLLVTYQEASDFLKAASVVNILGSVKWYGCDANVQKATVTSDPVVAQFAAKVHFLAPIMGIGIAGQLPAPAQDLSDRIFASTGLHPDAYALTAYDAVQIYGLAYDIVQSADPIRIKTILPSVCESYNYLGISRKLNDAGDLAAANYIFWTVKSIPGGFSWDSYATWMADGNYILLR